MTDNVVPGTESSPDRISEAHVPQDAAPTMADIDREVAEAMAAMDANDAAELSGSSPVVPVPAHLEPGAELVGTVVGVSGDDVFLQFDAKTQGVLARNQFGKKEVLDHGRRVDVTFERYDADSGLLVVSRKGALQRATWTNISVGMVAQGRVTGVIKGGLEIDLKGIRAFMPGSQVDPAPLKDISVLLNQTIPCEVLEVDRRHKNVLVSRRKVIERERAAEREKLLAELAPGQVRRGVVGSITDFGAFVDLGGVDGLVHISDLSWTNVGKVSEVLSVGQEIEVKVLKVDRERDRISLSYKATQPDPWEGVEERYPAGTALKARVTRLADFGAFAELEPGVEALVPLSEMGWSRVNRASEAVQVGDMVDTVVLRVELAKRRIALSMKQAQADPWQGVLESFAPQSLIEGTVTRLADFGAFVEIAPGVEGMIHISELSDKRVKSCGEVVKVGQKVETRVLGVDQEQRRISLSIKAVHAPTADAATMAAAHSAPARVEKKRKKPLRGGLASHFEW